MALTAEVLDNLERRYLPADQQKCRVCGAPLQFSSSGDFNSPGARYNCSSDDASPIRSTRPLRERLDHYDRSTWYDRGEANMLVVELVRAYRQLDPRAACPCFDEAAELRLRAEAADNTGDGDRWEDPRDTRGGETDGDAEGR